MFKYFLYRLVHDSLVLNLPRVFLKKPHNAKGKCPCWPTKKI